MALTAAAAAAAVASSSPRQAYQPLPIPSRWVQVASVRHGRTLTSHRVETRTSIVPSSESEAVREPVTTALRARPVAREAAEIRPSIPAMDMRGPPDKALPEVSDLAATTPVAAAAGAAQSERVQQARSPGPVAQDVLHQSLDRRSPMEAAAAAVHSIQERGDRVARVAAERVKATLELQQRAPTVSAAAVAAACLAPEQIRRQQMAVVAS